MVNISVCLRCFIDDGKSIQSRMQEVQLQCNRYIRTVLRRGQHKVPNARFVTACYTVHKPGSAVRELPPGQRVRMFRILNPCKQSDSNRTTPI